MEQVLEDYKAYYKTRFQRYAGDSLFQQSYQSEKDLYDCICSANSMNELMQTKAAQFRELSIQNGVAFVKDQAAYKLQFYQQEKETIKAKGQQEITDKINAATDAMQITSMVNEIQAKNDKEVLIDNLWPTYFFTDGINWLEKIEIVKMAVVPADWKTDMQKQRAELKTFFRESSAAFLASIRQYEPTWHYNYELLWQHRHRKKCPLPDTMLHQRINEFKEIIESK